MLYFGHKYSHFYCVTDEKTLFISYLYHSKSAIANTATLIRHVGTAFFNVWMQDASVAPVVVTSSTSTMCFPSNRSCVEGVMANMSFTFSHLSVLVRWVCDGLSTVRRRVSDEMGIWVTS